MAQLLTTRQFKLDKGKFSGVMTAGITLSPASEAGEVLQRMLASTCSYSGDCEHGCLKFAGMNQYPTHAVARAKRTAFWYDAQAEFLAQAVKEYKALVVRSEKANMLPAGRPNLLSDLPKMAQAIAARVPGMQFYDYTKIPKAWLRVRANYHLTYSASERSTQADIVGAFEHGINVAVVVSDIKKGEPLPDTYTLHGVKRPTIDGDADDLRFKDPVGVFVLLRWKGSKARLAAAADSGFARPTIALRLVS